MFISNKLLKYEINYFLRNIYYYNIYYFQNFVDQKIVMYNYNHGDYIKIIEEKYKRNFGKYLKKRNSDIYIDIIVFVSNNRSMKKEIFIKISNIRIFNKKETMEHTVFFYQYRKNYF